MVDDVNGRQEFGTSRTTIKRRRVAFILILIADAGLLAWGAMAALAPEYLPGPGSSPILAAGYEGFTGQSWADLVGTSPRAAAFMKVLFRVFGAYNVGFGMLAIAIAVVPFRRGENWAWWMLLLGNTMTFGAAMTYDRIVGAIGLFEMSEYVGLGLIYLALAVTAPFFATER